MTGNELTKKYSGGDRLKVFLQDKGMSQVSFANLVEVKQSNVSLVINTDKKIPKKWLLIMKMRFPELNLEWFETGRGEMIERETGAIQEPNAEYVGAVLVMDNERLTKYVHQMMGKVAFLESEVEDLRKQVKDLQKNAPK